MLAQRHSTHYYWEHHWIYIPTQWADAKWPSYFNTLRPRQNGCHFADDTFNRIFANENVRISIEFSLKFVPNGPINSIPALVQIMAWRRPGGKPLSEPMVVSLLTQWVKRYFQMQVFLLKWLLLNFYSNFIVIYSNGTINNKQALVQIMVACRTIHLPEPMMAKITDANMRRR